MAWTTPPAFGSQIASATIADIITKQQTWGGNVSAGGFNLEDLGAVEFTTASAGVTQEAWVTPTLQNGWTAGGSGFSSLRYRRSKSTNRLEFTGLILPGTLTAGTLLFQNVFGTTGIPNPTNVQAVVVKIEDGTCGHLRMDTSGNVTIYGADASNLPTGKLVFINGSCPLD